MADSASEAETLLDPGRQPPAGVTELDPGRSRLRSEGPGFSGLPAQLDARFAVVRVIGPMSGQADVLLVRQRDTGEERVLKLYRDTGRDHHVQDFLIHGDGRHTVRVFEVGTEDDRDYEVMEYLAGGDLSELCRPAGLDAGDLTGIVGQVTEALTRIHAAGIVHRDVKPANLMVRTLAPLDVALTDFGISVYEPPPGSFEDGSGSVRYMPPEFISVQLVSPAYDWWSLGATVLELATGKALLEGADDDFVRRYVTEGPLNVGDVLDERIRLLCQGLLAQASGSRWDQTQVASWLDGESPPVSPATPMPGETSVEVPDPYVYGEDEYRNRLLLATAMTSTWETAANLLFGRGREPIAELQRWLDQYEPRDDGYRDSRKWPADVRLVRLLRHMAPTAPPIYRHVNIARSTLPGIADRVLAGTGDSAEIVQELWQYELLPLLAQGSAIPDADGGSGLDRVHTDWRERWQRWPTTVLSVSDERARAQLDIRAPEVRQRVLAACLWAASADEATRNRVRQQLVARERALRLDWFTELLRRPDDLVLALLVSDYAEQAARDRDDAARAEAAHRRWLSQHQRFREWSRRQNRPLALSWAATGVFVAAVLCALLVSVSDVVAVVSPHIIVDAWVATAFSTAAMLAFEAVLAWEIGGRFHPRYSILGAAFIALGHAARSIQGRGIALVAIVAGLGGAYLLSVFFPVVTPLAMGGLVSIWSAVRYLAWCTERDQERAEAELGARELRAAVGP